MERAFEFTRGAFSHLVRGGHSLSENIVFWVASIISKSISHTQRRHLLPNNPSWLRSLVGEHNAESPITHDSPSDGDNNPENMEPAFQNQVVACPGPEYLSNQQAPQHGCQEGPKNMATSTMKESDRPLVMSCIPVDFEALPARQQLEAVQDKSSGARDCPIPIYVPCVIEIWVDGELWKRCMKFDLRWQIKSEYEHCVGIAEANLTKSLEAACSFYRVSHQYLISTVPTPTPNKTAAGHDSSNSQSKRNVQQKSEMIAEGDPEHTSSPFGDTIYAEDIPTANAWGERVPIKLASYMTRDLKTTYALTLRLSYTRYEHHPKVCSREDCFDNIYKALEQKKQTTYDGEWFVPSKFITEYFDRTLIEHLIEQCPWAEIRDRSDPQVIDDKEKKEFVEWIKLWAVHMLATTVYAKVSLSFLYKLWKAGMEDADMPLKDLNTLEGSNKHEASVFLAFQHNFKAHSFPDSQDPRVPIVHEKIPRRRIVPILSRIRRGSGASGIVYEITIHEDHHNFTPNRNEKIAMKTLKIADPNDTDFHRESEVLETLREVPHDHLTSFYASWSQDGYFNMLFPLAEYDLSQFLSNATTPELSDHSAAVWLLTQLAGLAGALNHIHNLAPAGLGPRGDHRDGTHRPRTGVHLDLSLKNVLLFAGNIMKISDFGTAKIVHFVSGEFRMGNSPQNPDALSNHQYAAPDKDLKNRVTRPYDIWSLGCIFLEILLWAFGKGMELKAFRTERVDSEEQQGAKTSAFYYKDADGQCSLKRAVRERIEWLHQEARGRSMFKDVFKFLILLVERMLMIDLKDRPIAAEVESTLKHLLRQAQLEISNPRAANKPRYAPPSTVRGQTLDGYQEDSQVDGTDPSATQGVVHLGPHYRPRSQPSSISRTPSGRTPTNAVHDTPPLPRIQASPAPDLAYSGAGADEQYHDNVPVECPSIKDDGGTAKAQESDPQLSALLQHMQAQIRPGSGRLSDPGRAQTN